MTSTALTRRERYVQKENLKRVHQDRMRRLRVLEYVDSSAIFDDSPLEIREGFLISDRDNGDLFLVLSFRNVSDRPVSALKIRVLLYRDHKPVPYERKEYTYSWKTGSFGVRTLNGVERKEKEVREETTIRYSETFGDGIYLPIPSTYFTKLQVDLLDVTYEDGKTEHLGLTAGAKAKRFSELRSELQGAYAEVNVFRTLEAIHPIRVLPEEGERVWLCCCGQKNPSEKDHCEICGRDRDWQLCNLTMDKLRKKEREMEADPGRRVLHDLTGYKPKEFGTAEEIEAKVEERNKAMEKLAIREREKEELPFRIFRTVLILIGIIAALNALFQLIYFILLMSGFFEQSGEDVSQTAANVGSFLFRSLRLLGKSIRG